jgi:anti-sigma factor RsiW
MKDTCAIIEPLLVRSAEGTASPEEQARLTAHLAECASCTEALADQIAMRELLQNAPIEGARLGFDARVMAAIRAEAESRAAGWLGNLDFRRWTLRLVPVAVALALAAVVINTVDTSGSLTTDATVETTVTANSDNLPVSSALWSESVSGSSLLSLMLTANADDTLSTYRKDQ